MAQLAVRMKVPYGDIDDVLQDAWVSVAVHFRQLAGVNVKRRVHCWLKRVVYGKAVDLRRRLYCCPCEPLSEKELDLIDDEESARAENAELREDLTVLFAKVCLGSEGSLRLLIAHFYHGRSIRELAYELGTTAKSVEGRIRRLLYKLREMVEHPSFSGEATSRGQRAQNLRKNTRMRGEIAPLKRLIL